jgi:ElaB/YqjD/DUF883 family membrane-anchored ribosome-binding protein
MQRVNADRLMRDLSAVAVDVDELVKSTAGHTNEAIVEARKRVEGSLEAARENLKNAQLCAVEEAKNAARSADAYLRENVWAAIGIAGSIGLMLGAIMGLKSGHAQRDRAN